MFGRCEKCDENIFIKELSGGIDFCPQCDARLDKRDFKPLAYFVALLIFPARFVLLNMRKWIVPRISCIWHVMYLFL